MMDEKYRKQNEQKTNVQKKMWQDSCVWECVFFILFCFLCLKYTRSGHQVVLTMLICDVLFYSAYLIIVVDL